MTEEERERLAKLAYDAMMTTLRVSRNKPHALIRPWAFVDGESQNGFRAIVDALVAEWEKQHGP